MKNTNLLITLLALSLGAGCMAEPGGTSPADERGRRSDELAPREPRVLGRGEVGCDPSGASVEIIGDFPGAYDLALERTSGCMGRLGFSTGAGLAEVIDPEPRTYGMAMGATLATGTRVVCADVLDAWDTSEALPDGRRVYRLARAEIWCTTDATGAWAPLSPLVSGAADAAWINDVSADPTHGLVVGYRRDSRFSFGDLDGRGRPDTDGAYRAEVSVGASGELVLAQHVFEEGYPFGPNQATP